MATRVRVLLGLAGGVTLTILLALSMFSRLHGDARGGLDGMTGYGEAVGALYGALPSGATVGAMQSGALEFFRPAGVEVVNLDGVVSRSAHQALVDKRLDEHMRRRKVDYLADWPANLRAVAELGAPGAFKLETIAKSATKQGSYRFLLTRVRWADAAP
jgi:hypothetical protein